MAERLGAGREFGWEATEAVLSAAALEPHRWSAQIEDDIYRKGVAFLLRTQYPDGTWLVKTHAFPVQRYFESGFPYGRHQWISTAGTSWATLAIAQTLPDRR
jgi:hypothetical protein